MYGVVVALSILWGWRVDGVAPDGFDLIGGAVALAGVIIIMCWPWVRREARRLD